ncbi:hypothetical protein BCT83_16590 [Vibrio tasmaniensis]|nr:hypothetical protein [Vibrio tasmaniensis]PML14510.1 hypothetical protein BCT83_16590 [Vibrio tasmaniensis]
MAANYLNAYFVKSDNVWLKTSELVDQTEIKVLGEYSATVQTPKFTDLPRKGERLPFVSPEFNCNSKSHTNVEVAHRIEKGDIAITESLI